MPTIQVVYADITEEKTDAIVNAANNGLYAGSGVCGAIHKAAGPQLEQACQEVEGTWFNRQTGEEVQPSEEELQEHSEWDGSFSDRKLVYLRCPTGDARTTESFDLPCKWVIHAVGPIWKGGEDNEEADLYNCHVAILREADQKGAKSVSIPAISTGIFGFPLQQAADIAVKALSETQSDVEEIHITVIDEKNHDAYQGALDRVLDSESSQ